MKNTRENKELENVDSTASFITSKILKYLASTPALNKILDFSLLILLVMSITLCVFAYNHMDFFIAKEQNNKEFESKEFEYQSQNNFKIDQILNIVLEKTNAQRVYVSKFHNGLKGVDGVNFFFSSRTNEVDSAGTSLEILNMQKIPTNLVPGLKEITNDQVCYTYKTSDKLNSTWDSFLVKQGTKITIRCPITNLNGNTVGYLGIDYLSDQKINPEIEYIIKDNTQKVAGLIIKKQ